MAVDAGAKRNVEIEPLGTEGILRLPPDQKGFVLFVHGSGSSRLSPRNNMVADALAQSGLGSLLFDLLTDDEAANRANVFDIPLLAERTVQAVQWTHETLDEIPGPVGLFGSSTGAAAALSAAAHVPDMVGAVVSRGGRPDLVPVNTLGRVRAPTLLIVGGADHDVLEMNRSAARALQCEHELDIVPGATHLFEEPGALECAGDLDLHVLTHLHRQPAPRTKQLGRGGTVAGP